jgi:hypothetical protein
MRARNPSPLVPWVLSAAMAFAPSALAEPAKPKTIPKKAPRIAVEPMTHDFGTLLPMRTVQKEFTIRNVGKKDLVILGVSTTCGCTVAEMETKVIKPGHTTPLKVNLETRGAKGRMSRSVLVRSNDPVRAVVEVKIHATVTTTAK